MKVSGENAETGEKFEAEAEGINSEFIDAMLNFKLTIRRQLLWPVGVN